MNKNQQRLALASQSQHAYYFNISSTWEQLMIDILRIVQKVIDWDHNISQGTVREIIAYLDHQLWIVNYEIGYIGAKLTINAETAV